jgi:hypothetical protein
MRLVASVLVLLATALPVTAQFDNPAPPGATARPAAAGKFHRSAIRAARLRAHAAARRLHPGISSRAAIAAARRKGPPPTGGRDRTLAPADRIAIQSDLAWNGDYNGLITGEFNDRTIAAIRSFQHNHKFRETGALNTQERAVLAAAAKARQAQVGWTILDEAVTGARLGIPAKLVPIQSHSKTGARWTSAQGQIQIETFKIRERGTTLAGVYEQQKKEPSSRKLEVNLLNDDFFILSGMQNLKKFYVRAEFKDGEVRGMTILYDQTAENPMDAVTVAMSSAFAPFPGVAAAIAQIGPAPKRKVEYGSGIVVSTAGHILTDREVTDGCSVIVVSGYGDADRQAEDKISGLALLRVYGVPDLVAAGFASEAAKAPDLTLLGIADPQAQGGGSAISSVTARLKGDAVEPVPQLGFSGGAALDTAGRIVGMVEVTTPLVAQVETGTAQPQASLVGSPTVRAFLEAQKLSSAAGRAGIDAAKASLVRVICVRK